jgi:hypothetical protein
LKSERILLVREWNINPYKFKQKERTDYDIEYGGKTNSLDEVTKQLNWKKDEFKKLKSKLDDANCISIDKSIEIYTIGYQRGAIEMQCFEDFYKD